MAKVVEVRALGKREAADVVRMHGELYAVIRHQLDLTPSNRQ
jgi:hypothetical protein